MTISLSNDQVSNQVNGEDLEKKSHELSGNKYLRWLVTASRKLDSLGVESQGIERISPFERGTSKRQFLHVAGLWLSATGGLSSM